MVASSRSAGTTEAQLIVVVSRLEESMSACHSCMRRFSYLRYVSIGDGTGDAVKDEHRGVGERPPSCEDSRLDGAGKREVDLPIRAEVFESFFVGEPSVEVVRVRVVAVETGEEGLSVQRVVFGTQPILTRHRGRFWTDERVKEKT